MNKRYWNSISLRRNLSANKIEQRDDHSYKLAANNMSMKLRDQL